MHQSAALTEIKEFLSPNQLTDTKHVMKWSETKCGGSRTATCHLSEQIAFTAQNVVAAISDLTAIGSSALSPCPSRVGSVSTSPRARISVAMSSAHYVRGDARSEFKSPRRIGSRPASTESSA
jgi:hypothetical protein